MRIAAIYARAPSEQQRDEQYHRERNSGADRVRESHDSEVLKERVFEDEGLSGAILERLDSSGYAISLPGPDSGATAYVPDRLSRSTCTKSC